MVGKFIPDIKKILDNVTLWKPGILPTSTGDKPRLLSQSTLPEDESLLDKLGIVKGDYVLSLASNHGNWAEAIQNSGCKVDYNEFSQQFIDCVKEEGKQFNEFIQSDFALIPNTMNKYDWSFSYEPVSGDKALPLAMLRSLLNKKGGIIMFYDSIPGGQASKTKKFPRIVSILAQTYLADFEIKTKEIKVRYQDGSKVNGKFNIYILKTNDKARELACKDIESLDQSKISKDTLIRLNQISELFDKKWLKSV